MALFGVGDIHGNIRRWIAFLKASHQKFQTAARWSFSETTSIAIRMCASVWIESSL
jgi:hypothetical protein